MDIGIKHSRLHAGDTEYYGTHLLYGGLGLLAHAVSITALVVAPGSRTAFIGGIFLGLGCLLAFVAFIETVQYRRAHGLVEEINGYPFGYTYWPERLLCIFFVMVCTLQVGRRH